MSCIVGTPAVRVGEKIVDKWLNGVMFRLVHGS